MLVYVDDLILTGHNPSLIDKFVMRLGDQFSLKDLGPPSYFLGIEITYTSSGMLLSQQR